MKLGLTIFATDQSIALTDLAIEAENRGYISLYLPEHTHIPSSRATPAPTGGPELPNEYLRTLDPMVALGGCAAVTKNLLLGSGVSLVAQHDPVSYAKEWATLDHVSGGRAVMGVGFGWNKEEMAHHGVEYSTRRDKVREYVLTMQALWSQEEASFSGKFINLDPSWAWPKPIQQPRIRTLVGGAGGPKIFAHISEWADGWFPIGGSGVREALPALTQAWEKAGRTGSPEVVPFGTLPSAEKLAYYEEIGCTEVVLRLPTADRDEVFRILDKYNVYL